MIRVYGCSLGNGSFAGVTRGVCDALTTLGLFGGLVPVDDYDEEAHYPGHDAEIGLYIGAPRRIDLMASIGWHSRRLVMVAPNSTWLPGGLVDAIAKYATGVVSPSNWGAYVLRQHTTAPISVFRHGVSDAPFFDEPATERPVGYPDEFHVLHLSSSGFERKGTSILISAWKTMMSHGTLPRGAKLRIVQTGTLPRGCDVAGDSSIAVHAPFAAGSLEMATVMRRHHLVCQPSRGEGFGLVPLEALAAGVPVCMTACTGHAEYVEHTRVGPPWPPPGAVLAAHGNFAPIDDGPGATAPSVSVGAVAEALLRAYSGWEKLSAAAREGAPRIRSEWSWLRVTREWTESISAA